MELCEDYIEDHTFYIKPGNLMTSQEIDILKGILGPRNFNYVSNSKILFLNASVYVYQIRGETDDGVAGICALELKCGNVKLRISRGTFEYRYFMDRKSSCLSDIWWEYSTLYSRHNSNGEYEFINRCKLEYDLQPIIKSFKKKRKHCVQQIETLNEWLGDLGNDG